MEQRSGRVDWLGKSDHVLDSADFIIDSHDRNKEHIIAKQDL